MSVHPLIRAALPVLSLINEHGATTTRARIAATDEAPDATLQRDLHRETLLSRWERKAIERRERRMTASVARTQAQYARARSNAERTEMELRALQAQQHTKLFYSNPGLHLHLALILSIIGELFTAPQSFRLLFPESPFVQLVGTLVFAPALSAAAVYGGHKLRLIAERCNTTITDCAICAVALIGTVTLAVLIGGLRGARTVATDPSSSGWVLPLAIAWSVVLVAVAVFYGYETARPKSDLGTAMKRHARAHSRVEALLAMMGREKLRNQARDAAEAARQRELLTVFDAEYARCSLTDDSTENGIQSGAALRGFVRAVR